MQAGIADIAAMLYRPTDERYLHLHQHHMHATCGEQIHQEPVFIFSFNINKYVFLSLCFFNFSTLARPIFYYMHREILSDFSIQIPLGL